MSRLTQDERDDLDERQYREAEQEKIDDADEAKREASGFSPEQIAIMDAANEGRKAGAWGFGASLNPHQPSTPEYEAWEKARTHTIGMRLNGRALRRMP